MFVRIQDLDRTCSTEALRITGTLAGGGSVGSIATSHIHGHQPELMLHVFSLFSIGLLRVLWFPPTPQTIPGELVTLHWSPLQSE